MESIQLSAFKYCESLTSITIPLNVNNIGVCAFMGCKELTSVTMGDNVVSIGGSSFKECPQLADVYYAGSEIQWSEIEKGNNNENLTSATIHYNTPSHQEMYISS